jgi:hypothetical protein
MNCSFCKNSANLDNFVFDEPNEPFRDNIYIDDQTDENYKFLKFMCDNCYSTRCFQCTEKSDVLDDILLNYCKTYKSSVTFIYDKELYESTKPYNPYPNRTFYCYRNYCDQKFTAHKKLCSQKSKLCVKCRYKNIDDNYTINYMDDLDLDIVPTYLELNSGQLFCYNNILNNYRSFINNNNNNNNNIDNDIMDDLFYCTQDIQIVLDKMIDDANNNNKLSYTNITNIVMDLYQYKINTNNRLKALEDENVKLKERLERLEKLEKLDKL